MEIFQLDKPDISNDRSVDSKYVFVPWKEKLLDCLETLGYPCKLEVLSEKDEAYPVDGTYILTLKNRQLLEDDE